MNSIESPYQIQLIKKRSLEQLQSYHQMSRFQIDTAKALMEAGLEIEQEVMIYNEKYPQQPFRIDIVVINKDLAIEIDGMAYHNSPKSRERDVRKDKAIKETGYRRTLRVPLQSPVAFNYDPDDDVMIASLKRQGYLSWKQSRINQIVLEVLEYPDCPKLGHSEKLERLKLTNIKS